MHASYDSIDNKQNVCGKINFSNRLPTFLPTAFLTKRSEQSWSEVYKKRISDQKFWAKIPWSEVYKNCISDQIQWSEMT